MSNCIKDLFDYDLVKKCSKCGIISLKSNFHKNKNMNDGFQPYCKSCIKKYYLENRDRLRNKHKCYNKENRDRIKEYQMKNHDKIKNYIKQYFQQNKKKINETRRQYEKNRRKTDLNYRLICNTRRRIHHPLNGKSKSISTKEILGIVKDTYKKWIEWQMTPDMTWYNIEIDQVKPICMFDGTKDEEMKEAFNWRNTQPLLKQDHLQKGIKFNFLDYQLQFIKAYQFIKLNEERFN